MCGQDESRALFIDELTKIASSLPGFAFHMHYFYKEGPLTRAFIDQHCAAAEKREFYICGPTPLLSIARGIAIESGVPVSKIHTEEFNLL